ncbi:MAG: hypothetical protein ACREPX_01865 [Rhodanobacteraceae bacterium]
MKGLTSLIIAATLLTASGCATTQSEYGVRTITDDMSINSDAAWATIDLNGDGALSLDELHDQRAMGLLQDFENADADSDSTISRQEWNVWWPRMTNHHIRVGVSPDEDTNMAP